MSYFTALLIFFICSVLAVVVAAPLILIARRIRRRERIQDGHLIGGRLTVGQIFPGLILVTVMFFAFAHQFIDPDSWLGSRVTTKEGQFWFSTLTILIFLGLNYCWTVWTRNKRKATQE